MRWDGLFADLEAQLAASSWRDVEVEAAELSRGESAAVRWLDRLRGAVGQQVTLRLAGDERVVLQVATVGPAWIGGTDGAGSVIVPSSAVQVIEQRLSAVVEEASASARLMRIGSVYRTLSRARVPVLVRGASGATLAEGTVDRVGADHLEVSVHARDELRRQGAVRGSAIVPFAAVTMVRSALETGW